MKKNQQVHLEMSHARVPKQRKVMEQIMKDGVCPFCPEHLNTYHSAPILQEGKWWTVTKNAYPYSGTTLHLLFIYKGKHIADFDKIPEEAETELVGWRRWARKYFRLKGYTFFIRIGDMRYTGGSVGHPHAQLVSGGVGPDQPPIKFKAGYKKQ
jgi:ATP adenylyltransferase